MIGGQPKLIKDINQRNVVHLIKKYGPIPRIELSRKIGISQTSISKIVSRLLDQNIVLEVPNKGIDKKVGRQEIQLVFNSKSFFALAIAVKRYEIELALVNCDGEIVKANLIKDVKKLSLSSIKTVIGTQIESIFKKARVSSSDVLGIGIAVSGTVSQRKGVVDISEWYSYFKGFVLKDFFEDLFPEPPVFIENDIFAMTKAEYLFGKGLIYDCMAIISCTDLGLSVGYIYDDILLRGSDDLAGEVGTIYVRDIFKDMYLAKYLRINRELVLDDLLKVSALVRAARNAILAGEKSLLLKLCNGNIENLTLQNILTAEERGDVLSQKLLAEYGRILGFFSNLVINFYNPEIIVFDGKALNDNHCIFETAKSIIKSHCELIKIDMADIAFSKYSHFEIIYGAASLVLQELFRPYKTSVTNKAKSIL